MIRWESQSHFNNEKQYDYGIVLGGMSYFNERLGQITFLRSADRLFQAVEMYRRGRIKKIFISGGSGSLLHNEKELEAEMLRNYLVRIGIPSQDIWFEKESKNTRENAENTVAILEQYGDSDCLLFTSAFHLRRAKACFRKAGLTVDIYATDSYVARPRNFLGRLLIPNDEALRGWTILLKEITGYIVYKIVGYA